jgi:hypothetical protein
MFKNKDLSTAVLADVRNVCLLLTRSHVKVVIPGDATAEERQRHRDAVEMTIEKLESLILQPIFEMHPDLPREIITIKGYLEGLQ